MQDHMEWEFNIIMLTMAGLQTMLTSRQSQKQDKWSAFVESMPIFRMASLRRESETCRIKHASNFSMPRHAGHLPLNSICGHMHSKQWTTFATWFQTRTMGAHQLKQFCRTNISPKLWHNHTFRCPVYALNNTLQANGRILKWNPRARLGINLGTSPYHVSSVTLILNLDTRLVSPQFHVQYNDFFETVWPSAGNECMFSQWQYIAGLKQCNKRKDMPLSKGVTIQSKPELMIPPSEAAPDKSHLANESQSDKFDSTNNSAHTQTMNNLPQSQHKMQARPANVSGYGRVCKPTQWMQESIEQCNLAFQSYYEVMHQDDYLLQDEMLNPVAFMAAGNKDTMYFDQAMREPDANKFIKAAIKKSTITLSTSTGSSFHVNKFLKESPYYLQSGPWSTNETSRCKRYTSTRHDSTSMEENKNLVKITLKLFLLSWHGSPSDYFLSSRFSTTGTHDKSTLSSCIHKLTSNSICTWSFQKGLKQNMAMARLMYSNCSRTYMVRSKQAEYGTNT